MPVFPVLRVTAVPSGRASKGRDEESPEGIVRPPFYTLDPSAL